MSIIVHPIKVNRLLFKNYCYLLVNNLNQKAVLIDPAWEINKIEEHMEHHRVQLVAILLTHHHFDHVNLAEPLAKKYQVPVIMSKTEIGYYGFSCYNLMAINTLQELIFEQIKILPILTPGHTKGSMVYCVANSLFSGDTLFIDGCGMCIAPGGDPSEMFDSLCYLKSNLPNHAKIYPGHCYGKEPGQDFSWLLANNVYLHFNNSKDFINFRMRKNQTGLFSFK